MSRYWYFAATLPSLGFAAPPPFGESEFLDMARRNLAPEDFRELDDSPAIASGSVAKKAAGKPRTALLKSFSAWNSDFRMELARLRARAAGRGETAYGRSERFDQRAVRSAAACFAAGDPLLAEVAFEKERWTALDELSRFSYFDMDFLVAYRLKLRILCRLAGLRREAGLAGYRNLYNDILARASRSERTEAAGEQQ